MSQPGLDITEDTLLGGRVMLLQPRKGYRVAIDPILLAASVSPGAGQTVLDVGAGTGAVSLCLQYRCPDADIQGLEREPRFLALARQSAELNRARVRFHDGDLSDWQATQPRGYDIVLSNPPFWSPENSRPAEGLKRAAHFLEGITMVEWVANCCRLLANDGVLSLIVPSASLKDVLAGLSADMGSIRILPLWPKAGQAANRLIVQATKGARAPLEVMSGLVLHEDDGAFTNQAEQIIRRACPLWADD